MPRPVLFIDLAGTLILRDPQSRRWVAWTGVAGLLHDLARAHDLHLTTGDSHAGARAALADLEVTDLFAGVHAGLPGGGKPFGALARDLGRDPARCLAMGDDPVNDTARDSDRMVSLLLRHETAQVPVARVRAVVARLGGPEGFLAGFVAVLDGARRAAGAGDRGPANGAAKPGALDAAVLVATSLGAGCRLGWWQKSASTRRAVVVLSA